MSNVKKGTPDVEVWAEPLTNIPSKTVDAFVVADLLADLMGDSSSSGGIYVRGSSGNNWSDWVSVGPDMTLSNVGFMRFGANGSVETDVGKASMALAGGANGGFYAAPVTVPRDNIVGDSELSADNPVLKWVPAKGDWKSVRSVSSRDGGSGVGLYCSDPEASIQSEEVAENVSFRGKINALGMGEATGNREAARVVFGNERRYALNLKQGMPPTIEQWGALPEGDPQGAEGWSVMKKLDDAGATNLVGGDYNFQLSYRAGRLVYDLNGTRGWVADNDEHGRFKAISWDKAPVKIETANTRARFDLALDEHKDKDGNPIVGEITRKVYFNGPTKPSSNQFKPLCDGYQVGGSCEAEVTSDEESVTYKVKLTPDQSGTISPFLGKLLLAYAPVWVNGAAQPPVNLTSALTQVDIDLGHPPDQDGAKGDISFDGAMLEKIPNWQNVVRDFAPITVRARWRDNNGVPDGWVNIFKGYQYGISKDVSGWNAKKISVPVRDAIIRLQEPASVIKENYYPLQMLLSNKNSESNLLAQSYGKILSGFPAGSEVRSTYTDPYTGETQVSVVKPDGTLAARIPVPKATMLSLYGGECVQAILKVAMGPATSNLLNETGNPMRFFPAGHLPLIGPESVLGSYFQFSTAFSENLQSMGGSSPTLPPPYGSDALSWINKFADDELADFFFTRIRKVNTETGKLITDDYITDGAPVPIYGNYARFLAINATLWQFDEKATPTNLDRYLESFVHQTKPEKNYNEVWVLSNMGGSPDKDTPTAALRQGLAMLKRDNPNASMYSWARTLVVRSNYGFLPGAAEIMAYGIMHELSGITAIWPDYTFKGEGFLQPGDLMTSQILEHANPSLANVYFRVTKVRHSISVGGTEGTEWKTTASCKPLSKTQLETAYGRGVPQMPSMELSMG